MRSAKVTIGITAYREGQLLQRAWDSVLNQTAQDWNAVLILDGEADDETKGVYNAINHENLQKFKFDMNRGPYLARTKAIELTNTEWFYFLDGDDSLPATAIETFYNTKKENDEFYCGIAQLIHSDGRRELHDVPTISLPELILDNKCPSLVAFKKNTFVAIGGYDKRLLRGRADFDFFLSLLDRKSNFGYANNIVYNYHIRKGSVSTSYRGEIGFKNLVIVNNHPLCFTDASIRYRFLLGGFEHSIEFYLTKKNGYKLV